MNLLRTTTNTSSLFQIPFSPTRRRSLSFSFQYPTPKLPSFHLRLSCSKTPIPDNFDFQDEEEFDEEEEEDEEEEDIFVPLGNMRQWTRNKPSGFGEGRVYDTSLEDKLLEELEHSRAAQLVNVNNLKTNPIPNPKLPQNKEVVTNGNGIRVRLVNLPKKKNIHRDLQAAFKTFPGITSIIPAVSGNQKTREPVCKGFAFVHFKSLKEANRFVDIFSTQPITFGKVQKQIRCEIMQQSSSPVKPSVDRIESPVAETPLDPCVEDDAFDMLKIGDDDLVSSTDDDDDNDNKLYNVVEEKQQRVAEVSSESSKKQKVVTEKGKKKATRAKNTPKLNIPGSANRLKMKEKALLSGVFSKYGGKSSD